MHYRIFIATDERTSTGLAYLRSQKVVLISDLLTPELVRLVGWPLLITDVLGLVDQLVMSYGAFFWCHTMSSLAGGVINLRGARGKDPETTWIE